MARCRRRCLENTMRIVNIVTNLLGFGMIVYSLWLQREWNDGVALLPTKPYLPRPWFIYTCVGVGIAVCLSTLIGCSTLASSTTNSTLCIYIFLVCSLFFLEVAVVVSIFFCMDWKMEINKYIDKYHAKFKSFVIFHLKMSRFITVMILIPQINAIALGIILWIIGIDEETEIHDSNTVNNIKQSFLVGPSNLTTTFPIPQQNYNSFRNWNGVSRSSQGFWSKVKRAFRSRFQRISVS